MEMETKIMEEEKSAIELPEECITNIIQLSITTPKDPCMLSLVSKSFSSSADCNVVWNQFLPSDLDSIISDSESASSSSSLLANCYSKKSLFLNLADHPIIIDNGKKSFQLDKKTGKKCYMFSARDLYLSWGDVIDYWNWAHHPNSRFQEVVELIYVWWFEIHGKINTNMLSSNTHYAAFLVCKMIDDIFEFDCEPTELSVGIVGGQSCSKNAWLVDPNNKKKIDELERPKVRNDGWLEIEMGEFFNSGLEDEVVQMRVLENKGNWKCRFYLEGIEIRPKN